MDTFFLQNNLLECIDRFSSVLLLHVLLVTKCINSLSILYQTVFYNGEGNGLLCCSLYCSSCGRAFHVYSHIDDCRIEMSPIKRQQPPPHITKTRWVSKLKIKLDLKQFIFNKIIQKKWTAAHNVQHVFDIPYKTTYTNAHATMKPHSEYKTSKRIDHIVCRYGSAESFETTISSSGDGEFSDRTIPSTTLMYIYTDVLYTVHKVSLFIYGFK